MNKSEFQRAFELANDKTQDFTGVDMSMLDGCGLRGFQPVTVTIRTFAAFLRWQALGFGGEWNDADLTECREIARHKITMVG